VGGGVAAAVVLIAKLPGVSGFGAVWRHYLAITPDEETGAVENGFRGEEFPLNVGGVRSKSGRKVAG
jgi:hypothetical protein